MLRKVYEFLIAFAKWYSRNLINFHFLEHFTLCSLFEIKVALESLRKDYEGFEITYTESETRRKTWNYLILLSNWAGKKKKENTKETITSIGDKCHEKL